jgi:sugar O-acyltransferase (sialic acid O-acetyltransferase NeuD family)
VREALAVRELLLVGTGGFGREAAEAARAAEAAGAAWRLTGFLDDDPGRHGTEIGGLPVLGPPELALERPDALLVLCTGRPDDFGSRRRIADRLGLPHERYAPLIHPAAVLGSTCTVGAGSVLLAGVVMTADAAIGAHVCVMPHVTVTHDVRVEDFATLASGVRLGGSCVVGRGAYLGSGACVREGLRIGAGAMVGMGAVVTRDVPEGRLWAGVPARDLRAAPGAAPRAVAHG